MTRVPLICQALALVVAGAIVPASAADGHGAKASLVSQLELIDEGGVRDAACVLIAQEIQGDQVVLSFATAAHLFRDASGGLALPAAVRIQLVERMFDVAAEDIFVPQGSALDVAVLRVTLSSAPFTPPRLKRDIPAAGGPFHVETFTRDGSPSAIGQEAGGRTLLALLGSRALPDSALCEGAAAVSELGVFGIVTACDSGYPPTVVPFAGAEMWLARHAPGFALPPSIKSPLTFIEKDVQAILPSVSCGEAREGVVDVPLALATNERAIDASVSIWNRPSLRVADVSVRGLSDRRVKLRFSLAGQPPPAFAAPAPCQVSQPLVTVHVSVVVSPRE